MVYKIISDAFLYFFPEFVGIARDSPTHQIDGRVIMDEFAFDNCILACVFKELELIFIGQFQESHHFIGVVH